MARTDPARKLLIISNLEVTDRRYWSDCNGIIFKDTILHNLQQEIERHSCRRMLSLSYLYSYYYQCAVRNRDITINGRSDYCYQALREILAVLEKIRKYSESE